MRRRTTTQYSNLEGVTSDREAVSWFWRFLAFASSWLIMGGYLILTPTIDIAKDDKDSQLRASRTVLSALGIVLYALGYAASGLVWFMCKNLTFRVDSIFTPCLTSSSLGLLTVVYSILVTSHSDVSATTIVSLIVAALSSAVYAFLLLFTWRQSQRVQRVMSVRSLPSPGIESSTPMTGACTHSCAIHPAGGEPVSSVDGGRTMSLPPWQTPEYYKNYIANMFPSMAPHGAGEPGEVDEEEQQRQQMLQLLMRGDEPTSAANSGTFRIDLQIPDEEPQTAITSNIPEEWRRMTAQQKQAMARGFMMGRQQGHRDTTRQGTGAWNRRGRQEERAEATERAVSREERRRQIEMGVATPTPRHSGTPF